MADSKAYTFPVNPIGSGLGEDNSVNQTSPSWVLTFVRWSNRDTLRNSGTAFSEVREPLVVENDCVSVTTTMSKGTLTPSMSAVLVMTGVNYETAVAPGDFVFVNMLNWEKDSRRVADAARAKNPINGPDDGFKGIFKVQSIRKTLSVDPESGTKFLIFRITGFAFTEFNNTIYFNPYLIDPNQDPKNQLLFASYIGQDWQLLVNDKGLTNVQDIIALLIQSFIGDGVSDQGRMEKSGTLKSPNVHFFMPSLVGSLLGVKGSKAAKDLYVYMFGIQQYAAGSVSTIASGMNPIGTSSPFGRFYYTPTPCEGSSLLKPEYWNQVKAWAIINQYSNAPLNELYTCFRISPNNKVMPTLVFRQTPFTNDDFVNTVGQISIPYTVTKFLNLPRWKPHPSLAVEVDLGREEAARVNFVQFFGRSTLGADGADIAQEVAQGNYLYDVNDVQRSGLRPYVVTTQFDDPTSQKKEYRSPLWAKILGDALIGGHLKMNGTIQFVGIVDPITVGDNLEFDGVVYHIEQVAHTANINKDGKKIFRTMVSLSNGVSTTSSSAGTRYPEMTFTVAENLRERDFKNNQLLPGNSDSQDVVFRTKNLEVDDTPAVNAPFVQPQTKKGSNSDDGDDT